MSRKLPYPAALLALAAVYFASAQLGLLAAVAQKVVSSVWPPTGVALAVLLLFGVRFWPGIVIGAFFLNWSAGVHPAAAAVMGIGNALEAVVAVMLLRRVGFRPSLDRLRDVLALIVLAALTSPVVSATLGIAALWLSGAIAAANAGALWFVWWSGDALGALIVAPLLLAWARGPRPRWSRARVAEAAAVLAAVVVATHVLFRSPPGDEYAVFPVVIWAALRFGVPGATTTSAVVCALSTWYTLRGLASFAGATPTNDLFLLQMYLGLLLVTGLVLAALTTERGQTEVRLARAQEVAHLGSWELDLTNLEDVHSNPLWWSDEVYRIFGYSPPYPPASNDMFFRSIHPEDAPRVQDAMRRAVHDGAPYSVDHRIVRPDGSERVVREHSTVERDAGGRPLRMVGTVHDITPWQRLEQQLRQAQKMEAVGQLAGGVAHDFNNLLTAVLGSADLLLEGLEPNHPERAEVVEIRKAAVRAADLVRQLLAFSRQQMLAPAVLDVNDIVAEMDKMLRRLIGEDVDLRTVLASDLGMVRADPSQLQQVVINLAVNARDAMPTGGRLTIETMNVDLDAQFVLEYPVMHPGPYVMIAVSDTGVGMSPEVRARVFEPFFTTKGKGKGTGLGLATAYGIVKQSGGYIWVYSEPGRGATFKIYLPRLKEDGAPATRTSGALRVPAEALRGGETILVVEDQEEVRRVTRRLLEARGYKVLVAAEGAEALRLASAQTGPIQLLVTDVIMPGMSGREVSQRLTAIRPEIKVLYLSGYTDEAIVHHGVLEPGIAFLQKPFSADALARKVREVLDGTGA